MKKHQHKRRLFGNCRFKLTKSGLYPDAAWIKTVTSSMFAVFLVLVSASCTTPVDRAQNLRVVWSDSPQTESVLVWDSAILDEGAILLYDTVPRQGREEAYAFKVPVGESGLYDRRAYETDKDLPPVELHDLFYHYAKLTRLKPNTVYYLAVKTADGVGREYHFETAPNDEVPFKLIYAGDSRSRIEVARRISRQISDMVEKDDSIIALLHGGDYALTTRQDYWETWLDAYALTTTEDGKLLPIIPVKGNHDSDGGIQIYHQAYGYPGGGNGYYAVRLSPSVGIVCLNTELPADGGQKEFLRNTLAGWEKDKVKWRIATAHTPIYPAVKPFTDIKKVWVPLFEEFNINLVLECDGHCIKRTVPIRNDQEAVDGIVYLGEGGYGAPQRDPKTDRWYLQGDNAFASKGDHIMMLEITPAEIRYSTILSTGEVADSATFKSHH